MDWKSNQQEIFWREYWQGHWLSCDAASINADLRVWVRMLLVPWSLVIVVQFHMIRPDNCVLIISMFTALHKILCSPTRLACGPARTVGSRRICTVHDLRLDWEIMTYSFSVYIEESTLWFCPIFSTQQKSVHSWPKQYQSRILVTIIWQTGECTVVTYFIACILF